MFEDGKNGLIFFDPTAGAERVYLKKLSWKYLLSTIISIDEMQEFYIKVIDIERGN